MNRNEAPQIAPTAMSSVVVSQELPATAVVAGVAGLRESEFDIATMLRCAPTARGFGR
jgi:hypothetical protein